MLYIGYKLARRNDKRRGKKKKNCHHKDTMILTVMMLLPSSDRGYCKGVFESFLRLPLFLTSSKLLPKHVKKINR
jgi:hypothetical protein